MMVALWVAVGVMLILLLLLLSFAAGLFDKDRFWTNVHMIFVLMKYASIMFIVVFVLTLLTQPLPRFLR